MRHTTADTPHKHQTSPTSCSGSASPLVYTGTYGPKPPSSPANGDSQTPDQPAPVSPKWRLQTVATRLLPEFKNLQKCYAIPRTNRVEVHRSPSRSTASYRGLCTCQSVSACPVCSARISATRAQELTDAIQLHRANGGTVLLLTLTIRHTRDDTLTHLHHQLRSATQRFFSNGTIKRTLKAHAFIGRVSSLEVTYGHASGWHPHIHTLLFVDANTDPTRLIQPFTIAWYNAARASGSYADPIHGIDLRGGESAGQYVAKLGLEVALAVRKLGRTQTRYGIWQLLHASSQGSHWASEAFQTYARAMKRKHHLSWSRGLKRLLSVEEVTDAEIMESNGDADEEHLCDITRQLWYGIRANNIRGELLQLLGLDDIDAALELLLSLGLDPSGLTPPE